MLIKILENQNKAKVLSNPRVTTLNNKEAEIFVGDRVPYTVTSITGGVATSDVRFEEPGIRLTITPSIIEKDFVVIKVEPEVSYIFSFRGPNDQYPWVKKRHATAYVRVKNNQPFVLGGLLNEEDKSNLFKVPLLGNIPLIGNLFTYRKQTILDTELIITITPKIVYENI
jgi:general secretion pathway protein D